MKVMPGSWLIASVCIERITAMSSTILEVYGSRSLIQVPLLPCWAKLPIEPNSGNDFCRAVMPVTR